MQDEQDLSPSAATPATAGNFTPSSSLIDVTPCMNLAKRILSNLTTLDSDSTKADSKFFPPAAKLPVHLSLYHTT